MTIFNSDVLHDTAHHPTKYHGCGDGLMQDCRNYIVNPLEWLYSCIQPSIYKILKRVKVGNVLPSHLGQFHHGNIKVPRKWQNGLSLIIFRNDLLHGIEHHIVIY